VPIHLRSRYLAEPFEGRFDRGDMTQLDFFTPEPTVEPSSPMVLRTEERYGHSDAKCGLPLPNTYSREISGDRLAAYERGFRAEVGLMRHG
jgi:hypothetical protein